MKKRWLWGAATAVYAALLAVFYWKYVPLVAAYQVALVPPLLAVTVVTAIDIRKGLLAFIFLFPLINNLPYFFKLYEPLPMAPSALVLFLFFFLGRLLDRSFGRADATERPREPVFTPLRLFAALVAVSALITFWRYTNFFPLWRPRIYELVTNVKGVSAGGALMSVVFFSLTYLTGIAFFATLVRAVRSEAFVRKALAALGAGAAISLAFALVQRFAAPTLGNNPGSLKPGLINATFEDALSFGAFLSIVLPLAAGLLPLLKGKTRTAVLLSFAVGGYLLLFSGSKSALLAALAGFAFLGAFVLYPALRRRGLPPKLLIPAGLAALVLLGSSVFLLAPKKLPDKPRSGTTTIERMADFSGVLKKRAGNLWAIAARLTREFPLSGVGAGAYIIEMANEADPRWIKEKVPESAENLPLQVAAELGLPGLFLFLWILWELAKRAGTAFRRGPPASFSRTVAIAASAGLAAFLLNAQAHTYIGSYEIHYLFWLLAALLFAGDAPAAVPACPPSVIRRFSLPALIVLGGVSLLWNSASALSLNARAARHHLRQEFGFGPAEKDPDGPPYRWIGRFAGRPVRASSSVKLRLLASHPDIRTRPVRLKVFAAADLATRPVLAREITLGESRWEEHEIPIPAGIRGTALLLFETDRTWNPRKAGVSADPRDLGLAVGGFKASGLKKPAPKKTAAKPGKIPPKKKKTRPTSG